MCNAYINSTIQSLMKNIARLFKQVAWDLLGPLTFVNIVHIYTLLKSKYDSFHRLWKTALKLDILVCAAFKLCLCAAFLIIVIMLSDFRFIILIYDTDLQGQLLLF